MTFPPLKGDKQTEQTKNKANTQNMKNAINYTKSLKTKLMVPMILGVATIGARADVIGDAITQVTTWATALVALGAACLAIAAVFKGVRLARKGLNAG